MNVGCGPDRRQSGSTDAMRHARRLLAAVVSAWATAASPSAHADDRGRALYEPCRACHALDPVAEPMAGPNLAGLIGRRVGGDPRFDYSPALRKAWADNLVWTPERLNLFLADPEAMFPGLWMATRGISDPADREGLVRFLSDPDAR
jgi:cytochrome c